jgi:DNA-binding HxlR family transcriptional regulator
MSGYGQFCPVAQALEVLGERWTLLIVREILCGSHRFSELQRGVPVMSRSMLAQRLRSLCEAGVIERRDGRYFATEAGQELRPLVIECGNWGKRWIQRKIKSADVDVSLLMWDIQRRIALDSLPRQEVVVEMEFRGAPRGKGRFWLHFTGDGAELCLTKPARGIDLTVCTTPRTMAEIWLGDRRFADAQRSGELTIEGPSKLARAFPTWLQLSMFAAVKRRHAAAPALQTASGSAFQR